MTAPSASELLERLERELGTLLSNLEGASPPDPVTLDSVRNELERCFSALCARIDTDEMSDADRAGLAESARRCLRLQVVARTLLSGHRETLLRERDVCAGARARLRRIRAGGSSGASCDVSG